MARRTIRAVPEAEVKKLVDLASPQADPEEVPGPSHATATASAFPNYPGAIGANGKTSAVGFDPADISTLKSQMTAAESMTRLVPNLFARIEAAEHQINALGQQRDAQMIMVERQTRHSAMDLAIKAAPADTPTEGIIEIAQAMLAWLRAGTN